MIGIDESSLKFVAFLFHINKPYAGQLFVSFFGDFFDEIPLKFVAFLAGLLLWATLNAEIFENNNSSE